MTNANVEKKEKGKNTTKNTNPYTEVNNHKKNEIRIGE